MIKLAALTVAGAAQATARFGSVALAQPPAAGDAGAADAESTEAPPSNENLKWGARGAGRGAPPASAPLSASPLSAQPPLSAVPVGGPRQSIARVTKGPGTLPNDAGQEWRDYDISPYTARVTSTARPEQAVLDWILRETGYEAWHGEPVASLSIDSRRLRVYHTPAMHAVVSEMVDRFVNSEAESQAFGMRIVTLRSPDWRAKHHKLLHPVPAQTQGVQAWLMAKEDAALLVADLRRRSDFMEHSTPHLLVNNGQSKQISATQTRNYLKDVLLKADPWPGFEPQMAQFDEGFKLEFNPLLSLDGRVVDAVLKCEVDQVEKMVPVMIDVPTSVAPRQRQQIEVPQPISSRMHERFRWPADQILLVSLGVGPAPVPTPQGTLKVPLLSSTGRADMLLFVESRGKVGVQATALQPGQREANAYHNRY